MMNMAPNLGSSDDFSDPDEIEIKKFGHPTEKTTYNGNKKSFGGEYKFRQTNQEKALTKK